MRVSEHYGLGRTQPSLDFVDVDVSGDVKLFIDPRALRLLPDEWADGCVALTQNFFSTVLQAIGGGRNNEAQRLLLETDCVIAPIYFGSLNRLISPRIEGLEMNVMDILFLNRIRIKR